MTPNWYSRDLKPGDQGEDVRIVQLLIRAEPTGYFDDATTRRLRGYQRLRGLRPTGRVDETTANYLGELR